MIYQQYNLKQVDIKFVQRTINITWEHWINILISMFRKRRSVGMFPYILVPTNAGPSDLLQLISYQVGIKLFERVPFPKVSSHNHLGCAKGWFRNNWCLDGSSRWRKWFPPLSHNQYREYWSWDCRCKVCCSWCRSWKFTD